MTNPLMDPRTIAGGLGAGGSLLEKGAEAMLGTKTGQSIVNKADNAGVKGVELNDLKNMVVNNPLCDHDELSNVEKAFCSRPVDKLFDAYLDHSLGHGAVLCVHDAFGNGKSATASIVARGRHPQGPNRFLVVTPDSCATG